MKQFRGLPLVVLYVGYVLIVTLYPFAFAGSFSGRLGQFIVAFFTAMPRDIKEIANKDFVYNVFFFVPLGVLLYCSLKSPERSRTVTILMALVAGGALSFIIELCQAFFGRHPSASDVLA